MSSHQDKDPYLDAGMKGWIVNTAKREYWRVTELCDLQDLVQDGYLCYAKCRCAYPKLSGVKNPTKDHRRQFQALVSMAFANHISSLAVKHKGVSVQAVSQLMRAGEIDDGTLLEQLMPSQPEQATFLALLASAPAEIKQLIELLISDGLDLLKFERKRTHRRLLRETTNEFYCRILHLDPITHNIAEQIRTYFR